MTAMRVRTGVAFFPGLGWHVVVEIDGNPVVAGQAFETEAEAEHAAGIAAQLLRDSAPHIDGPGAPVR